MSAFDSLFLTAIATLLVALVLGNWRRIGIVLTLAYGAQLFFLLGVENGDAGSYTLTILGQTIGWQFDGAGRFFALITLGAAALATWFASGEWAERYEMQGADLGLMHIAMATNVLAMLLLLASADLISLFLGWELVSWASFFLMTLGSPQAARTALRYVPYAMTGAMAILAGLGLVYALGGSLDFAAVSLAASTADNGQLWTMVLLFGLGFGIKMGLLPFHLWQAPAYAETSGPANAFLAAISARMGLFAIALVVVKLISVANLMKLAIIPGYFSAHELLLWIAAFTIVLPTYTALKQNDARYLLAWHGIGQGGYMLMGLLLTDSWGTAGGLLHVFNYATYQMAIVMSVFAVMHRTGTADLNRLGGLFFRMPLSFMVMLIGIIGLAGLPPMNGFVSKWLVYRSLMNEGMPLLFLMTVIGTLGTILSVYKLIHNTFLGQLRTEHESIREAPWSMMLPMLILCVIVFATGTAPGLVMPYIADAQTALGLTPVEYTLGGFESAQRGGLDMLWVVGVLFAGFGIGAVLFYGGGGRTKRVHQLDNYAGGHFLSADVPYHYSNHFYAGLMHRIGPWYKDVFRWAETAVTTTVSVLGAAMQGLYRQQAPAMYLLVAVVIGLGVVLT